MFIYPVCALLIRDKGRELALQTFSKVSQHAVVRVKKSALTHVGIVYLAHVWKSPAASGQILTTSA